MSGLPYIFYTALSLLLCAYAQSQNWLKVCAQFGHSLTSLQCQPGIHLLQLQPQTGRTIDLLLLTHQRLLLPLAMLLSVCFRCLKWNEPVSTMAEDLSGLTVCPTMAKILHQINEPGTGAAPGKNAQAPSSHCSYLKFSSFASINASYIVSSYQLFLEC